MENVAETPELRAGHVALESSLLASTAYDEVTQVVEIAFKSGGCYRYSDFPPEKWDRFRAAESAGKFFLSEIKGKHEFSKVVEPKAETENDGA